MKLNYLLSVCLLSVSLVACNEEPKAEKTVVIEKPVEKTEVVKVIVEQPKAEPQVVVQKDKVIVEKEKDTKISIGSKGASLKTKNVDIDISE